MSKNILTIKEYFNRGTFVIPNYQRGYKWGVPNKQDKKCAVSILMDNLIEASVLKQNEYFVQGVTVYEETSANPIDIFLIDGQQRTTTFYLILKYLNYQELPIVNYTIREESKYVLNSSHIKNGVLNFERENSVDYNLQDIYYFNKAVETIHSKIIQAEKNQNEFSIDNFKTFILDNVKLFYIKIDKEKATRTFTMMNGQKAHMKVDELVKSSILCKSSRSNFFPTNESSNTNVDFTTKWEVNALRSRYAREWDKWLYWWNRSEVKNFFESGNNPMGLLLEYYFDTKGHKYSNDKKEVASSYAEFERLLTEPRDAKKVFKEIRDLQKTFEDLFNNPTTYNYLGLIIKGARIKKEVLKHFIEYKDSEISLEEYAKWAICGAKHYQIMGEFKDDEESKEDKALQVFKNLSSPNVYEDFKEDAYKQLLRRNVKIDCDLQRKFDFRLYTKRSLEHINPKSWEKEEDTKLNFHESETNLSVNSIGNLILICSDDNSAFGKLDFEDKKKKYFEVKNCRWSLKLLHSVSVFSKEKWDEDSIKSNQESFLKEFKDYYSIQQQ